MRFSLGKLLLIFPAFFLGTFAAWLSDRGETARVCYRFDAAISEVRNLRLLAELIWDGAFDTPEFCGTKDLTVNLLNDWLAESLPSDHPLIRCKDHRRLDPWGNPYRCVSLNSNNSQLPFGFYSAGSNGISQTDGNDSDDLNSWNPTCRRCYEAGMEHNRRKIYAVVGFCLMPLTYAAILMACWWVGPSRFFKNQRA
jgi:hypothetical protein